MVESTPIESTKPFYECIKVKLIEITHQNLLSNGVSCKGHLTLHKK